MTPAAPTQEIGTATRRPYGGYAGASAFGEANWHLLDDPEYVPDLKWPLSRDVFDKMRWDSQIHALWMGMTQPIRRYRWMLDPNGARPEIVQDLSEDLGLPVKGEAPKPRGRTKRRFSHDSHLYHALLALLYGFNFFEQVGEIVDNRWRLRKLGPRLPHSIESIRVERDGGLAGIRQNGIRELIPVDRLVAYVWQKEGANWYGRSMIRPMYKNWFIKDKLIRVDLVKHERNGLGVPTAKETLPDISPAQRQEAQRLVNAWRAGNGASATLPYGIDIELKGVSGTLPDTLASIRYHDEAMARSMLMMFLQLGQTETGSRALGSEFIDYFALTQETVALWYADTTNEHVIEDYVDWNYGEEELAPLIIFERDEEDDSYPVSDLVALIDKGAITVDAELEAALRSRGNLPEKGTTPSPAPPGTPQAPAQASTRRNGHVRRTDASESSGGLLPDRTLRRQPYKQEIQAQVNFAKMDTTWQSTLEELLESWQAVKAAQIDELIDQIAAAESVTELVQIDASAGGTDVLSEAMAEVLYSAVADAVDEAAAQGVEVDIDADELIADLEARAEAVATTLAKSLSEAAGRRALGLWGGGLDADEVAAAVKEHLEELSNSYLEDQFGGALTQAQNAGRVAVFEEGKPTNIYASELLDTNTCGNCVSKDGTEYGTLAEASADYPTGGYRDCQGGPRCRGTLVAVYGEDD